MTQIISIIGVSGVGKTSLVRALNARNQFALGLESHTERPFQADFKTDSGFCLANQFDFLLFRAEQEKALRDDSRPALVDGGLDLDFHGFTRLFHARGWLSDAEFELVRRFYHHLRGNLPPPNLILHLTASEAAIQQRLASRNRINLASFDDTSLLATFIDDWLKSVPSERLVQIDVTHEAPDFGGCVPKILKLINTL
jgi:deoxyadenosine/deoxycytidine kinase